MKKSYKTKAITAFGVIVLIIFSLVAKENYVIAQDTDLKYYSSNKTGFNLSIFYPKDWKLQERGSSQITPFAIVLSDVDMTDYHYGYPDKFINVVFYKTDKTEQEYAISDLNSKKATDIKQSDTNIGGAQVKKYESDFKNGKYLSAYKRNGDYLIIFETYIKNPDDRELVEKVFDSITGSFKLK